MSCSRKLIFILFFFLLFSLLYAENHMDLIAEILADTTDTELGGSVAALDFNGDGIDDLAVGERWWTPGYINPSFHHGRLQMFLGKETEFGDSADFEITGHNTPTYQYNDQWGRICNLGDINNDGFEDLGFIGSRYDQSLNFLFYVGFLLGGNPCDSIPDFIYAFNGTEYISDVELNPLGDINGDGFDDVGFGCERRISSSPPEYYFEYGIVYGGGDYEYQYFRQFPDANGEPVIKGIGDVNTDGFDDFVLWYNYDDDYKHLLYYGSTVVDSIPDLLINDYLDVTYLNAYGCAYIGDWNGDGYDDFVGSSHNNIGIGLWFGGNGTMEPGADAYLEFYSGHRATRCLDYGDLNGDGFDDVVVGYPTAYGLDGRAYIYLGPQNGTKDYWIDGDFMEKLSWGVAIGDYNNDGFKDLALGCPGAYQTHRIGKVKVYAGNPMLEELDPDIGANGNEIPNNDKEIEFNAYPNPFNPSINFEINIVDSSNLQIEVYNIKGQKVDTIIVSSGNSNKISLIWNAKEKSSGVYCCKLMNIENNQELATKKVTLLK